MGFPPDWKFMIAGAPPVQNWCGAFLGHLHFSVVPGAQKQAINRPKRKIFGGTIGGIYAQWQPVGP